MFADGMDFPLLALMPDGSGREARGPRRTTATPRPGWSSRAAHLRRRLRGPARARCGTCGWPSAQLEEYPAVRLWAELSVLAHLTGWPMPVPRTALLSAAADDAVPAAGLRYLARSGRGGQSTGSRSSPAGSARSELAAHVSTAIRSRGVARQLAVPAGGTALAGPGLPVDAGPGRTQDRLTARSPGSRAAPAQRGVGADLRAGDSRRHLRAAGGRAVQRWYDGAQRDAWEVRAVAFGLDKPAATVELAVGALSRGRRLRGPADRVPRPVRRLPLAAAVPDLRPAWRIPPGQR